MAFAKNSAPAATSKQVSYLKALVEQAGYGTLKDARHELDLTQRQAGGRFTRAEASELIERLVSGEAALPAEEQAALRAERAEQRLDGERAALLAGMPANSLAMELERRGWSCEPPP